jgi:hypothetical protein
MSDRETVPVGVHIAPDLSSTGKWRGAVKPIDTGVADIVEALQAQGITMRGSCSGHQHGIGEITLQDGRTLLVVPAFLRYWEVKFSLLYRNEEPLHREAYWPDIPPPERPEPPADRTRDG